MKKELMGFMALVMAGVAPVAMGQATIPYSNSFEAYAPGSAITNDANWTSSSAVTVITNVNSLNNATLNRPYMTPPIPSEAHTKVLSFSDAPLTNSYTGTEADPLVVIDAMIQPNIAQDLTYDAAVSNSHFSISFVTNGVAIWHGVQIATQYGADYGIWSILNAGSTPVSSGKWCRLTITLNYQGLPTDTYGSYTAMFQVKVDGLPLTSPYGHVSADMATATNGSWLLMAPNTSPTKITALTLNGSGMIDDLNVQASTIGNFVTPTYGIPYQWMTTMGVTNDTSDSAMAAAEGASADADGDGMMNWQEYFAGTIPTDSTSKLVIVSQSVSNGLPTIKWIGTTNALAPYSIAASTNLLNTSGWIVLTNNLVASEGTNTLTASVGPALSPAFFRIMVVK